MEEVFDLRVFVISILRRWRVVLVSMAIFFLLAGAFRLIQLRHMIIPQDQNYSEDVNDGWFEQMIGEGELVMLELRAQYVSDLLLHLENVTTENSYSAGLYIALSAYNWEQTSQLVAFFYRISISDDFREAVHVLSDRIIPAQLISEFFVVNSFPEEGLIHIAAMGYTPEICYKMLSSALTFLSSVELDGLFSGGVFFSQLNSIPAPNHDIRLYNRRLFLLHELQNLQSLVDSSREELLLVSRTELHDSVVVTVLNSVLRYSVLGLAGGAVLGVMFIFLFNIMSVRVWDASVVQKKLGIITLIKLNESGKARKLYFIDKWIDDLTGELAAPEVSSSAIDKLCADIILTINNPMGYKLHVITTLSYSRIEHLYSAIKGTLEADGVVCSLGEDVLQNADSTRSFIDCDGALFIDGRGELTLPALEKILSLKMAVNRPVIALTWLM